MKKQVTKIIKALSEIHSGSFYLYEEEIIKKQIDKLLENFKGFEFLYSIKTNPYKAIIEYTSFRGIGADAASSEEVMKAIEGGVPSDKILYSTPGKTREDIERTIGKSIIIADSYNELALINKIATSKTKVGLRINLDYNMSGTEGGASKFGVDEITLHENIDFINSLANIDVIGIHVHLRSQVLDYELLYKYYEKIFEMAIFCKSTLGFNLEFINFGGGLGIPYSPSEDKELNVYLLGGKCEQLIERFKSELDVTLYIESGRFIVCEAGKYVTKIVDIKESYGTKYLIVEKGLNGFMRPSVAVLLDDYFGEDGILNASEPLYTSKNAFGFTILNNGSEEIESVDIVGSLCTSTDTLVKGISLPKAEIEDLVVLSNAGSYAYSLSPLLFASHSIPKQIYVKSNQEIIVD